MKKSPDASRVTNRLDWDFRLARILGERKDQEGSYLALEKAIEDANAPDPGGDPSRRAPKRKVDRRKLTRLIEGDSEVAFSASELRSLDAYLEQYGEGLAYVPIFEKPHLMQALADSGQVTFLLGSKSDSEREGEPRYFSHWDVLAMAEIQRGINASEGGVRLDIQDAMLEGRLEALVGSPDQSGWEGLLEDPGPSLVCLGSSRTSPATEVMLCRMFDCPPNADVPEGEERKLPFHFVWGSALSHDLPSCFRLRSKELKKTDPTTADLIEAGAASALVTKERVFVDTVNQTQKGDTYGVCIAQRRKGGQVWLIVAGITGAATYATAKLARNLATRLHEQKRGVDSDIYWAVVRAHVTSDPNLPANSVRNVTKEEFEPGTHVWQPEAS
jgi:hypothetical protein